MAKLALDACEEIQTVFPPSDAPIVYRLGQEILILQSGVRFPVGAPFFSRQPGQENLSRHLVLALDSRLWVRA